MTPWGGAFTPRLSLRLKLIVGALVILAAVLALLLSGFQAEHARRREAVLADLTQTAEMTAVPVDASFDDALALAQTLADDPVVQTLDPDRLNPYLERLVRYRPDLNNLGVADAAGNLVSSAVRSADEQINIGDRRYFQQAMATGSPAISEVILGRVIQRPVVVAAAPLRGPAGRPSGVAVVSLRLDALADRLSAVTLRSGQALFLADPMGRLAFHTSLPDLPWETRDVSSWPEVQAALAGRPVRTMDLRSPLLGDRRVAALVPTPRYGWVVGVTWPAATAFGPVEQANRQQLVLFGGIAIVGLAGMVLLATYLTAPLRRLADQARALGQGDLTRRVTIRTGDELEELGRDFNTMAEQLEAAMGALVAARREAEVRLREAQEERRRREMFTSAVGHDLKNLMTPILGTTQLLLRRGQQLSEEDQRLLSTVHSQALNLNRLVADLLDVSRIEAGRFAVEREPTDLAALSRRIVEAQQTTTARHRIRLEAPKALAGRWDPDRLAQVLTNLLGNAVKYSPDGGEILVRIGEQEGQTTVCVCDQGIGLSPEEIPLLFQPYSRLYRERQVRGLGLGLYITSVIVEAHGGRIWAESAGQGKGAAFCFALPRSA
ncbi:MAG: sensor histidine kinase [Chloroflexi bacterium]|nr:sensor histidine kinase [Chloroflexota bacterium]